MQTRDDAKYLHTGPTPAYTAAVTSPALTPIAPDMWVVARPLRFMALFPIGTRMSVVRLKGGALWLCSPVEIEDGLADELDALGTVSHLIGPNRFHHLYLGHAHARWPRAQLHLAPGLAEKRTDLTGASTLTSDAPEAWRDELDQHAIEGVPTFNEVAFLHRASRTLILTDHLFHLDESCPAVARALGVVLGVRRKPGFPLDARLLFVRDREALKRSLLTILGWDFDRIVLTHGKIVEQNGPAVLREAYTYLLGEAPPT